MPSSAATARRARLDRDAVVDAALALADAEGLEALTIRRLAKALAVTPMALYWHFEDKDALLAGIGDRMWADAAELLADRTADVDAEHPLAGWEELRATTEVMIEVLRRHPSVAPLAPARVLACEAGLDLTERALTVLVAHGVDVGEAAELARWMLCGAMLLVMQEPGAEPGHPDESDALRRAKQAALASLPADRYPHVLAAAGSFSDCGRPDDYYGRGLDLVLAGIRSRLVARSATA